MAHWRRCIDLLMESGDSLEEMWWLIDGQVVAHWRRCFGLLMNKCWLTGGDVLAY